MTLPQDHRSPHDQARWLEIENVGSVEIPAFGACELVDSVRVESSGYTPGDGRIVYKARRSTVDSPCASIINFACPIPPGQSRRIGTMDSPMLATVADYAYPVNTQVGIKKDSFLLEKGYCGYLIVSTDFDVPTGTLRVKQYDNCGSNQLMARAYECIKPGDMDRIAIPQRWNSISRCYEDDPTKVPIKICDCNKWLLALPGECFKVERDDQCGAENDGCWRPSFPYGLTRRVKITSEIAPSGCETVTIMKGNDGCMAEESECTIQACNPTKRRVGCDADEYATFHAVPGECGGEAPICYGWIVPDPRPLRATATLTNDLCSDTATFHGIQYMDVCGWTPRKKPNTGGNPIPRYACAGKNIELTWNDCDCRWDVLTVQMTHVKPILDLRCPDVPCDPITRVRPQEWMWVEQCQHCGATEEDASGITGTEATIVTGVEVGEGSTSASMLTSVACTGDCTISFGTRGITASGLVLKRKKYCFYCSAPEDADDGAVADVAILGSAGAAATLVGTRVTVVTGIEAGTGGSTAATVLTGVTVDDDTGEETPACGLALANVALTGTASVVKRKSYCMFCVDEQDESDGVGPSLLSVGSAGVGTPIQFTKVEPATDIVFDCEGCPTLDWDKTAMWAICVGSPSAGTGGECTCDPCEQSSASSTPSAKGA